MALAGSRYGTGGISTSPAPSRPRADRPLVRRDPRVPEVRRLPAVPDPTDAEPPEAWDAPEAWDTLTAWDAAGAGAAARPQTLQYPSSIVPPQLVQVLIATALPSSAPSSVSPRTAPPAGRAPRRRSSARNFGPTGRWSAVAAGPRSRTGRILGAAWRSPGRRARR